MFHRKSNFPDTLKLAVSATIGLDWLPVWQALDYPRGGEDAQDVRVLAVEHRELGLESQGLYKTVEQGQHTLVTPGLCGSSVRGLLGLAS